MDQRHPNRRNFEGILTRLDIPSDKAPGGTHGHRVIVSTDAARAALDTLIGMPIGFGTCWTIHNYQQRCGHITDAWIDGDALRVRGNLYAADFPSVITVMEAGKLGMSYEVATATVPDLRAEIWTLTDIVFSGAAILLADKAAYTSTRISLAAAAALCLGLGEDGHPVPQHPDADIPSELTVLKITEG